MKQSEISSQLVQKHDAFWNEVEKMNREEYEFSLNGEKWNAGQQVEHILIGTKTLNKALRMPSWLLKRSFGKANRPSKTYDELVARYHERLSNANTSATPFLAKEQCFEGRDKLLSEARKATKKLINRFKRFSEKQADQVIIPHPLLGKVTLREMEYFFIYHVEHHHELTVKNLSEK